MPKRGFWNDRNYYQAQKVSYVKSNGRLLRLVYGGDGVTVQGYDVARRIEEELANEWFNSFHIGTSLVSSLLTQWERLLRICWRK